MKRIILLSFLAFSFISCGPVYKMHYDFSPPASGEGRVCAAQCENTKQQCQRAEDSEYDRCKDRAELDYRYCKERNRNRYDDDKESCYRSWCSRSNYANCDSSYRTCYETCGGNVSGTRVCVSNCEQAVE